MSIQLNRNLAITLLFSLAILLALARPSSANAIIPDPPYRRDHVNLNRMIKIRAPFPPVPRQHNSPNPSGPAANNPSSGGPSSLTPSSTSFSAPLDTAQPSSASLSPQPSSSPASSVSGPATSSVLSTLSPSSVSSTSTAPTSTATSVTHSTLSPPPTSSTSTSTQGNKALTVANGESASVDSVTLTSHVPAPSSSSADNSQIGGSSLSHSAITILIVLAASIGGCAIIWTIIRKWKFRPSAQFEDRLEPVNWQPTEHESGLPTHRRMLSNASSFHSAGHENMAGLSRSDSATGYDAGRSLTPLPEHDFTAGAAPVGGYADLARGPSPQPQMQEALQYGPSVNQGYENYLGPTPHVQGGHSVQDAYDHNDAGARY